MSKVILLLLVQLLFVSCSNHRSNPDPVSAYREIVTCYDSTDEEYRLYGTYKRIDIYNGRAYRDSFYHSIYIDDRHFMGYYLNEFGDTITKIFTDTSNYPRRED